MKKPLKKKHLLPFGIFLLAFILRFINLPGLTTFDWDQARDIQVISGIFKNLKPTLIGPIVKGEGGFFLGPLYYYLLAPFYLLFQGSPLSLSVFSILMDSLFAGALYLFLKNEFDWQFALAGSLFWAISWFNIQASHVPWNVTLLQPWMLALLWLTRSLHQKPTLKKKLALVFLAALSIHIHLSLVPLAFVFLLFSLKPILQNLNLKKALLFLLFLALPLLPLVAFDLRHSFTNSKLFLQFLQTKSTTKTSLLNFLSVFQKKLGYTITRFFLNQTLPKAGLAIFFTLTFSAVFKLKNKLARSSFYLILTLLTSLLIYQDPNFAEYYLYSILLPLFLLFFSLVHDFLKKLSPQSSFLFFLVLISLFSFTNLSSYNFSTKPFSLKNKKLVTQKLLEKVPNSNLELYLPPGRKSGFEYLLKRKNYRENFSAKKTAIISESTEKPGLENAEKTFTEVIGGFRLTILVVQ